MADTVYWDHAKDAHRVAFATALAPLVAVLWKRGTFGKTEAMLYMRTLKHVPPAVLADAADRALATLAWFPEPVKLLALASDIVAERRRAVFARWLTDCVECDGTRWRPVIVKGIERWMRCPCWLRAQQEADAIGAPIPRPQLPAHQDEAHA